MATLTIRNLSETTKHGLRLQSARHARSMEAEARAILDAAVDRPQPTQPTWFDQARAVAVAEGVFAADEFDGLRDREPARAASFGS